MITIVLLCVRILSYLKVIMTFFLYFLLKVSKTCFLFIFLKSLIICVCEWCKNIVFLQHHLFLFYWWCYSFAMYQVSIYAGVCLTGSLVYFLSLFICLWVKACAVLITIILQVLISDSVSIPPCWSSLLSYLLLSLCISIWPLGWSYQIPRITKPGFWLKLHLLIFVTVVDNESFYYYIFCLVSMMQRNTIDFLFLFF